MHAVRAHTLVAALVLAVAAHPAAAQERVVAVTDPGPEVETVGTGERRIAPDRATVNLLVESKATEAAAAAAANSRSVRAVRDKRRDEVEVHAGALRCAAAVAPSSRSTPNSYLIFW